MAAAQRERKEGNPYEDGGGFGKFRKRPFRKSSQTTPYDRPPTAIRGSGYGSTGGSNNSGWLSKLVDPAQRLIASSAHKLFASVFRKRLPPPPAQPPEPEANQGTTERHVEADATNSLHARVATANGCDIPSSSCTRDGVTELELILKQKTFTRSELDRLTALLESRTVDLHVGNEEKKSETIPSKVELPLGRKEFPNTPIKENGTASHLVSTPNVNSTVLDEDVASPAELAKAYMGSRSSKVSPSMVGWCRQPLGGHESRRSTPLKKDSAPPMSDPHFSKSPIMPLVPKSSSHAGFLENGYITPRSRGRSAIYSMARTPYSRGHSVSTLQGHASDMVPSSQNALDWDKNRFSGSKQGALKRRSSVFDNDIGSTGPIRRIRQKSNLLPSPGTPSIRRTGSGLDTTQDPSSSKKPVLVVEPSKANGENSIHGSGFTIVPSKSSEMASKILQQLDVLVSSREKSPAKLSPSMLRGPALRSLENVDSSNLLENVQDNNKSDVKHVTLPLDTQDSMLQKQDKVENGPIKLTILDKSSSAVNNGDDSRPLQNDVSGVKTAAVSVMDSAVQLLPKKNWAFQMSAHEDLPELDDNLPSNNMLVEGKWKPDKPESISAKINNSSTEAIAMVKPPSFSEFKQADSSIMNQQTEGTSDVSVVAEKGSGFTFPKTPFSAVTVQEQSVANHLSTVKSEKTVGPTGSSTPSLSFSEKPVSPKEPNGAAPKFDFGYKASDKSPLFPWAPPSVAGDSAGVKFASASVNKPESSSSTASIATGSIVSMIKDPESGRVDDKNNSKAGFFFRSPETMSSAVSTQSTTGMFSFGSDSNNSTLNNGSSASTPISVSSSLLFSNTAANQNAVSSSVHAVTNGTTAPIGTTTDATSSTSHSHLVSMPSTVPSPIFKYDSSAAKSTSSSSVQANMGNEQTEAKIKETTTPSVTNATFGAISSTTTSSGSALTSSSVMSTGGSFFGSMSSAISTAGSNMFSGTSSAIPNSGSNITSSTIASTGSNIFGFSTANSSSGFTSQSQGFSAGSSQASATEIGLATSSQSMPAQFGSSASPPPFGLTGSTGFSSGSSLFSPSSKPFSSGVTFESTSSSDANMVGSRSSSSSTTMFNSSWQAPKSPIFASTFNSSSSSSSSSMTSVFPFGASSSNTSSSNTPVVFGSSTNPFGASSTSNATTSSTTMLFGSSSSSSSNPFSTFSSPAATTTTTTTAFPNSNSSFAFAALPPASGNNDQISMEDSMAEDTVQPTPTVPVFNQQPSGPSSSGFVFATTAPSGGNQFSAPTVANPFQFANQANMGAPQSPSPFQASGSLEFNAGGNSFSLGSGGGGGDKSNRKILKVKRHPRKR